MRNTKTITTSQKEDIITCKRIAMTFEERALTTTEGTNTTPAHPSLFFAEHANLHNSIQKKLL